MEESQKIVLKMAGLRNSTLCLQLQNTSKTNKAQIDYVQFLCMQ